MTAAPDFAGRDEALSLFTTHKPSVVAALRARAFLLYNVLGRAVSANDVRPVLSELGYEGNPSILVSAFPAKHWAPVGWVHSTGERAHARMIRTYVPR